MYKTSETVICGAQEAQEVLRATFPRRYWGRQECFLVLALNAKHQPIGRTIVAAVGSASSVEVHPREVFRPAIERGAVAIIVAHNHPSGDPEPSVADRRLTERLKASGDMLGIPVLDHIVLGGTRFVSLASRGEI